MAYEYLEAGKNSRPGVKKEIEKWKKLPAKKRTEIPLLYWLLGSGTPPYKMSKKDSNYRDNPKGKQKCVNCSFIYHRIASDNYICSQISGKISPNGWCRLWESE